MATLGGYYLNRHRSQYDPDSSQFTRSTGCGPTTVANGANASTGGHVSKTAQQVHDLVPRGAETDPSTPGWSIPDQDRAAAKLGTPFENRTGKGWANLEAALHAGQYVALQGDSDQFSNNTCSGAFDGDHDIGIHPARRVVNGLAQHWIDDPICKTGRWEYDYILRRYASKLSAAIRFAVFTHPVPRAAAPVPAPGPTPAPAVTRYRAVIIGPTKLYAKVGGNDIGSVSRASYTVTKLKYGGLWWYKIVTGNRAGQAIKPGKYTKFAPIS